MAKIYKMPGRDWGREQVCLTFDQIMDYVDDKLPVEQRSQAENHFKQCNLCREAMEGAISYPNKEEIPPFIESVDGKIKAALQIHATPKRDWPKYAIAAVLLIGIVSLVSYPILNPTPLHEKLFAEYFETYHNIVPLPRSEPNETKLEKAMRRYNSKDYTGSLSLLQELIAEKPDSAVANFYAGIASLKLDRIQNAIIYFNKALQDHTSELSDPAEWYSGLAYLKENNIEQARQKFENIIANDGLFANQAAELLSKLPSDKEAPGQNGANGTHITHSETQEASESDSTLADKYFAKAQQFSTKVQFDSAKVYFEKAAELYEVQGKWDKHIRCYYRIGSNFRRSNKYEQAMVYLKQALEIGRNRLGEQHLEVASCYVHWGQFYDDTGEYDQAIHFFEKALSIRRAKLPEQHPNIATSYATLGNVYQAIGDYDKGQSLHEKALSIRKATLGEQHNDVARSYASLGVDYAIKGFYDEALVYCDSALTIWKKTLGDSSTTVASLYNNIGSIYQMKGDYDQAIIYLKKALSIWRVTFGEKHTAMSVGYGNLGINYALKNEFEKSIDYQKKALKIKIDALGKEHPGVASSYLNLGVTYIDTGEYDLAIENHNKALFIWVKKFGEQNTDVAECYISLAEVYLEKGKFDKAIAVHKKGLPILLATLGERHPTLAKSYSILGDIYAEKKEYNQALDSYQQAIHANIPTYTSLDLYVNPKLDNVLSDNDLLESLSGKARMLVNRYASYSDNLKELEAAVSTYQLATKLIDRMRSGYKAEGSKLLLAEQSTEFFNNAIQTALRLYGVSKEQEYKVAAFKFAEKSKAGVLLEALFETEAKQFGGIPDSLLEKERQLRIDLAFYDKSLMEEQVKKESEQDSAKIALWQDKVFGLKQSYDALIERFEKDYPNYFNLKYQTKTVSVQDIQEQVLDENTALVEYFTSSDSIFIFTITKRYFEIVAVTKDSLFAQWVEQLHNGINHKQQELYSQSAYRLYQLLLAPIVDRLDIKHLIIIPDGILNTVPFEALLTEPVSREIETKDYPNLPYMLNKYTVSYAYSATLLLEMMKQKRAEPEPDFVAFAPVFADSEKTEIFGFLTKFFGFDATRAAESMRPLLASRDEVNGILTLFNERKGLWGRFFGSKSRVYLEKEANEANLKSQNLADYGYVHLATHGLVHEDKPKLSHLLLAQDSTSAEDNILHLAEVYNLNLNADLVTLSACETGLGKVAKGEGIIGLTRGFLYAGASNVLVSLWKVNDETTADLMIDFYAKMLDGKSKAEALREAKIKIIENGKKEGVKAEFTKPYYWAPFILIGR